MKLIISTLIALLYSFQLCIAQTDTNILAIGDWSEPVRDVVWPLRGRLIVYDAVLDKGGDIMWPQARVYLELQHVPDVPFASKIPIAVRTPAESWLHCEMRDARGMPIPQVLVLRSGRIMPPVTLLLPPDSTLRLRVDGGIRTQAPDVLAISVAGGDWKIRPGDTNEYYLSGIFNPAGEAPDTQEYHVWRGTLQLPSVKIPADKIRKR